MAALDGVATETDVTTLSRYVMEATKDRDLTILMNALQLSSKCAPCGRPASAISTGSYDAERR